MSFSALQRAENSQWQERESYESLQDAFQCSSASRKFSIIAPTTRPARRRRVSVLFSEPKILNPTVPEPAKIAQMFQCSSASRKFSIIRKRRDGHLLIRFQCSSASRKFSMLGRTAADCGNGKFQCSSASRKFSILQTAPCAARPSSFSALQRAENSQSQRPGLHLEPVRPVSVLFSEPKILNRSRT